MSKKTLSTNPKTVWNRNWRKANPEEHAANRKRDYDKNPEKHRAKRMEYYYAHQEEEKAKSRAWTKNNPKRNCELSTAWAKANPEKVNAIKRKCAKARAAIDPAYKIRRALSHRLFMVFKRAQAGKSADTMTLLGCSIGRLMEYLHAHFQSGMNFSNHGIGAGRWVIDHRKPLVSFNLLDPEEQKKACHFTNLQPLWHKDNESKNDTYPWPRQTEIDRSVNCFATLSPSGNRESSGGQLTLATL